MPVTAVQTEPLDPSEFGDISNIGPAGSTSGAVSNYAGTVNTFDDLVIASPEFTTSAVNTNNNTVNDPQTAVVVGDPVVPFLEEDFINNHGTSSGNDVLNLSVRSDSKSLVTVGKEI